MSKDNDGAPDPSGPPEPAPSQPQPAQRYKTAQQLWEQKFLQEKRDNFAPYESRAWKWLNARFGKIAKEEVLSLGQVVSHVLGIELTREYKRRKETMIRWFEDHYDQAMPFIRDRIQVIGRDKKEILLVDQDPFVIESRNGGF